MMVFCPEHPIKWDLNPKFTPLSRAANNFPAGTGQIVRSNLFLLGHIPFLAGQKSITSYRYKSTPSPRHMTFKYETSKFSKHLLYMSIDLNAGKVERLVQQNQYHIFAYYYCLSSTSYIQLVMKLMKLTEACNLPYLFDYKPSDFCTKLNWKLVKSLQDRGFGL